MEAPERYLLIAFLAIPLMIMPIVMWRRRATIKMPKNKRLFISGFLFLLAGLVAIFAVDQRIGAHGQLLAGVLFVASGMFLMKEVE